MPNFPYFCLFNLFCVEPDPVPQKKAGCDSSSTTPSAIFNSADPLFIILMRWAFSSMWFFTKCPVPPTVIGADILDKTNQNAFSFGRLREEPSWFHLEENQRQHFEEVLAATHWSVFRKTVATDEWWRNLNSFPKILGKWVNFKWKTREKKLKFSTENGIFFKNLSLPRLKKRLFSSFLNRTHLGPWIR